MNETQNTVALNSLSQQTFNKAVSHYSVIPVVAVNSPSSSAKGLLCMESQSERHGDTGGRLGATLHTTTPLLVVPQRILGESG